MYYKIYAIIVYNILLYYSLFIHDTSDFITKSRTKLTSRVSKVFFYQIYFRISGEKQVPLESLKMLDTVLGDTNPLINLRYGIESIK